MLRPFRSGTESGLVLGSASFSKSSRKLAVLRVVPLRSERVWDRGRISKRMRKSESVVPSLIDGGGVGEEGDARAALLPPAFRRLGVGLLFCSNGKRLLCLHATHPEPANG